MATPPKWDIFCTVVDNYGDIGVCWRLARQLADEHGLQVRLWVDDLVPLAKLQPDISVTQDSQRIGSIEVRHWGSPFPAVDAVDVADVVIEAFACDPPASYLAAMAARSKPPLWINLEYLSAEEWVEGAHGLASPHPRLSLTKYFFFPGFTPQTGGLLKEGNYERRRTAFDAASFRAALSLPPKQNAELTISLFGYENPALPGLLDAWSRSASPITCLVPEGRLLPQVRAFFGQRETSMQRGHLSVHVLPFVPQDDYDALLWLCDLNFVRGEDSFVRAQWANKPMVWHIYPQGDAAHMVKLEAFLARYLDGVPASAAAAVRDFWMAWNDADNAGAFWPDFIQSLPVLQQHAMAWSERIAAGGDLAARLLAFASGKVKK